MAVVVISLARNRPALALGNVVGSVISNILGAFSLGLVFRKGSAEMFDRSSRIYTAALLAVTSIASGILAFGHGIDWRAAGGTFVGLFGLYIASISFLIANGFSNAPQELSDSDTDSNSSDDGENIPQNERRNPILPDHDQAHGTRPGYTEGEEHEEEIPLATVDNTQPGALPSSNAGTPSAQRTVADSAKVVDPNQSDHHCLDVAETRLPDSSPLTGDQSNSTRLALSRDSSRSTTTHRSPRGLAHHVTMLVVGFIGILLSSYVLSNAATNLVDQSGVSDLVFGVVILSIVTTIPEKFIAILSGYKGHMGIMVANTVGSNIFLLTLCLGIIWLVTDGEYDGQALAPAEIAVMFGSTVVLTITILLGGRFARVIGVVTFIGYLVFITLEFTVIHGLGGSADA